MYKKIDTGIEGEEEETNLLVNADIPQCVWEDYNLIHPDTDSNDKTYGPTKEQGIVFEIMHLRSRSRVESGTKSQNPEDSRDWNLDLGFIIKILD